MCCRAGACADGQWFDAMWQVMVDGAKKFDGAKAYKDAKALNMMTVLEAHR